MSSSDSPSGSVKTMTGRVFVGVGKGRETLMAVEDFQGRGSLDRWSREVEQEVMQRVQAKAAAKAAEILAAANAEARMLRDKGFEEGYAQGIAQAQEQLQQAHQEMSAALGDALAAVQQGRAAIWEHHRRDLQALVVLAVERICNIVLDTQRREVLAGHLDQAVEALDTHVNLLLTVHPADAETLEELLTAATQRHPRLAAWRIRTSPAMQPGGLLVESDHGMVDNTLEGRRSIVEPLLRLIQLELPETEPPAGKG